MTDERFVWVSSHHEKPRSSGQRPPSRSVSVCRVHGPGLHWVDSTLVPSSKRKSGFVVAASPSSASRAFSSMSRSRHLGSLLP